MHTLTRASVSTVATSRPDRPSSLDGTAKGLLRLVRTNGAGTAGAILVLLLIVTALFAQNIAPYSPTRQGAPRFLGPGPAHWMGTDGLGRDIFSRVVFGTRVSLYVGLIAVTIAFFCGSIIGILSGFFGGTA